MEQVTFAYRAIVFALKGGSLNQCLPVKKLLGYRSVTISEHPPQEDGECEYAGLHYHGLVEHPVQYRFDCDRIFLQIRNECDWFKSEVCKLPVNFLAYMQVPPRNIVFRNDKPNSDFAFLEAQITPELIKEVGERKQKRMQNKLEGGQDIMTIKNFILESGAQSESELLNEFHDNKTFETLYCKRTFSTNFKKALNFAIQTTLDKNYLDLCTEFIDRKKECMTPQKSADLVDSWLKWQKIDPLNFCQTILTFMDKKKRKLNTVILQGDPNSGKTFIAKSICKASIFYGEVSQGTAGYAFMWQDCVNKRFIVINEPFFDSCMVEQLKIVLEGTGTFVHKKNCGDEYLRPTPVMITTNTPVWNNCGTAKDAIEARCLAIFDKLKPAPMLRHIRKDLHPRWLGILLVRYAPSAPPTSDIEDEECTSRGTSTADLVPMSNAQTQTEDQQTISTPAADNTTLTCPEIPKPLKKRPMRDLGTVPRKLDFSEIHSDHSYTQPDSSDNSPEETGYLVKKQKLERGNSQPTTPLQSTLRENSPLDQYSQDYFQSSLLSQQGCRTWRQAKLELEETMPPEEEEDKCPQ